MTETSHPSIYSPRYWFTWLGLAILRMLNLLPFQAQLKIGELFGKVLYRVAKRRRHIAQVNIKLCFPTLSMAEQETLVKNVFINSGISVMETAMAWWSNRESFRSRTVLEGSEYIDSALAQGKGVILLGAHFSTLDLGGLLFSLYYPLHTVYRQHNNPAMESVIATGRLRSIKSLIDRSDFRSVIRALKRNEIVWYAPDQDFGPTHSVYAPFFGVNAATVTATARLAKMSKAPIIMLSQHRSVDGHYHLRLHPPVEPFPLESDEASATRINAEIEKGIGYDPAQYMWVHRRFKTNSLGKNLIYDSKIDSDVSN